MQDILDSALALSDSERAELADALIESLSPEDQIEFDDAFLAEIERRCDELDEGRASTIPWEQVKARVLGRLGRHA